MKVLFIVLYSIWTFYSCIWMVSWKKSRKERIDFGPKLRNCNDRPDKADQSNKETNDFFEFVGSSVE